MENYKNKDLSFEERALDLVSRMTRDEKINFITNSHSEIERLGVKVGCHAVEIARGLVNRSQERESTILPQPWGMAAMFDPELMEKLGVMAGDETRIASQSKDKPTGLMLFGPTVDMERDPRWGRNEEAYGEDPCLTAKMSCAYTKGLKGYDEKYIKTAPLLKHFYANNYEKERKTTNSNITPRLKHEYYLKAFEPAITKGGAVGLMTAYNLINGVEGVNNPEVTELCKDKWGMTVSVSDGGDFGQNVANHRTYDNHAKSIADILGVGADLMLDSKEMVIPALKESLEKGYMSEAKLDKAIYSFFLTRFMLGDFDENHPYANMDASKLACDDHKALAVEASKKSMVLLENKNLLPLENDGKSKVAVIGPLANENYTCWYCGFAEKQTTVVDGFRKYLGEDRVIFDECFDYIKICSKLTGKYLRIADNGDVYADATKNMADEFELIDWDFGSWTLRSLKTGKYLTEGTHWEEGHDDDILYKKSFAINDGITCTAETAFGWFVKELLTIDKSDDSIEFKTWKNTNVYVDENAKLVSANVYGDVAKTKFGFEISSKGSDRAAEIAKKADYVICCAGNHPLINSREEFDRPDLNLPKIQTEILKASCSANENTVLYMITGYPFAINEEKDMAKAVLMSSHLGPCLGNVAAQTIFGENNPAGRTPTTWYKSVKDLPSIDDYDIMKNRTTYLYFDGTPLYEFGYGLSYTNFKYSDFKVNYSGNEITASVNITNTGDFDGDEIPQLYVKVPKSLINHPIIMLKDFKRVTIKKNETVTVDFSLTTDDLAVWFDEENRYLVEKNEYVFAVGSSSKNIFDEKTIDIDGEVYTGRDGTKLQNALNADDYSGTEFLTDKTDWQTYFEANSVNSFAVYKNIDLKNSTTFECNLSSPSGSAEIILLNNDTGEYLGVLKCPGTGSLQAFKTVTCDIIEGQGLINLRIIFAKHISFKNFRFI